MPSNQLGTTMKTKRTNPKVKPSPRNEYSAHIPIRLIVYVKMRRTSFGKIATVGNAVDYQRDHADDTEYKTSKHSDDTSLPYGKDKVTGPAISTTKYSNRKYLKCNTIDSALRKLLEFQNIR